MARNFDGTNDRIVSDNNAVSGINTAEQSIMAWVYQNADPTGNQWVAGTNTAQTGGSNLRRLLTGAPVSSGFTVRYSVGINTTTSRTWRTNSDYSIAAWTSCVVTMDRGGITGTAATPTMWVNNASVSAFTVTENNTGTALTGDDNVRLGENSSGGADLDAAVAFVAVVGSAVTAADANRFYWWGTAPGGPSTMQVWLPMWTANLNNVGSGGNFAFTATGTTNTAMPKVERCWAASMGCGR